MIETRGFTGKLNTDDNDYRVPNGDYVDALNITRDSQGSGQDEVVANIIGNQAVPILDCSIYSEEDDPYIYTYIGFGNSVLPYISISIRLFDGTSYTEYSTYTTAGHGTYAQIATALVANATPTTGVSISMDGAMGIKVTINTSLCSYISVDCEIDNVMPGVNTVIGNYADRVRNRLYYFTQNSAGYSTINYYDVNNNVVVNLIADIADTIDNVQVLNFQQGYRINHIDIIYREEGDLLFWTDGYNPPRKLNVSTALAGGYGPITSSYLDVAKEPPSNPPYCVYYDDTTVTLNNLNNKLFKFKYRFVFDDLEKSVTSAQSEVPIPKNYSDQAVAADPTKNNNIFMVLDTGAPNVKKIEILGSESLGETWSDFFLIQVLDKNELSIADNDIISYRFYNNRAYNTIPIDESIQPFDNVPQKAYTQSLPNGNVLDYGAITENYDLVKQISEISASSISHGYTQSNGLIVNSDYGDNQIKIIVGGQFLLDTIVYFNFYLNGSIVQYSLTLNPINASGTVQTIYSQIKNALQTAGYTVLPATIDSTTSYLLVSKAGATSLNVALPVKFTYPLSSIAISNNSGLVYDWNSRYSYGAVYFDDKGRTNGVITALTSTIETINYTELSSSVVYIQVPKNVISIKNRPPLWASYYELVRTKNLTKSNFLYWVSYRTYKDAVPNQLGFKYAYISIINLTNYLIDNPNVKTLGYEFVAGDRIRFVKLYNGAAATIATYSDRDYQIIDSVTNPLVNGEIIPGQVIKILLPSNLGGGTNFDFGGDTYANYLIELYTPAESLSEQNNLYYEFGQRFRIFNSGTSLAYHQGNLTNQTSDLVTPASIQTYKGDSYFRYRNFPREGLMRWKSEAFTGDNAITLNSSIYSNTNSNTDITPNNVFLYVQGAAPTGNIYVADINPAKTYTFFVTGTLVVVPNQNLPSLAIFIESVIPGGPAGAFQTFFSQPLIANQETTISYSLQITNAIGDTKLEHGLGSGLYYFMHGTIKSWVFDITINNSIVQGIADPNFSDYYDSAASPNGRSWRVDPNAKQTFNPTLIRFGEEFQPGTTINNINRFYEQNFDVYDRSRGSIKKMFIEGRNQYIFQEFDVGVVTVLTQIVRDTAGNPLSAQSDKLLNKIVYPYIGQYGIGNVPESFAYGKHAKYFVDNNKGVVCRLSTDGITPISILYKMNNFFVEKLKTYKLHEQPAGWLPFTVYGAFDAYTNKYIIALQAVDEDPAAQPAYTLSFLESRKDNEGFEGFLSFHPENIGALNNLFISFYNGQPWVHNSSTYNNFYGVQHESYVDVVFNDRALDRKTFLSIMETANAIWYCPSVESQLNSYGSTPQKCVLVAARFSLLEGQYQSAILRDMNSQGGMINGDTIHGNFLVVRFQKDNASDFYYLNTVSLNYINSPLNLR